MAVHRRRRASRALDARRSVRRGDNFEVAGFQFPQRGLAGKQFEAGFLGRETCRQAGRFRSAPGVGQFALREDPQQVRAWCFGQQTAHPRDINQVDAVERTGWNAGSLHEDWPRSPFMTRALHMPPKPRFSTSAMSPCRGVSETARLRPSKAGSGWRSAAIAGAVAARRHQSAITASSAPAAAMVWPKAHLNEVTTGAPAPNT